MLKGNSRGAEQDAVRRFGNADPYVQADVGAGADLVDHGR